MDPVRDVAPERGMDRPVPRDPGHRAEGGRRDDDTEMAFARSVVARVAGVTVAFVHDLEPDGGEGRRQARADLLLQSHFPVSTPSLPAQNP